LEQLSAALRAERNKNSALKGGFLIFNEKNYAECLLFLWKNDIILTMDYLLNLLAKFLAVIIVLTLHEFAHAFTAYKCGDPTAKWSGRMTLNPLKHFDPIGAVLFAFTGFGWAKPVPINPDNFKNRVWGSFFTSIAGVFVNYLFAFLTFPRNYLIRYHKFRILSILF
jgi:Zn-dependent protease